MFFWGSDKHRTQWRASNWWKNLAKNFNEHYINIVKTSSGTSPSSIRDSANLLLDETTVGKIIDTYRNHPSVIAIKSSITQNSKFSLLHPTTQDKSKIINLLSPGQSYRSWQHSSEITILSANVIDSHLANVINKNKDLNCYSENAKIANVRPIFKKDERTKVKNYRPFSLVIYFLKFMRNLYMKIWFLL